MKSKRSKTHNNNLEINLSTHFITASNRVYKRVLIPIELCNDTKEKLRAILYLIVYYYQVCNLSEAYRIYKEYNCNNKEVKEFLWEYEQLSNNKKRYINICTLKANSEIRGDFEGYFKLTDISKATFLISDKYNFIKDLIEMDIDKKYRLIDSYTLAIKQHTSLKHYAAINHLYLKAAKENVEVKCKHDETSININCFVDYYYGNRRKVEWDLIMRYNNKQVGIEVELGTTSNSDMYKKVIKHHALSYEQNIYKDVIIACPNKKALDKTRDKIEKAIERYYVDDVNNFHCSFCVRYYYLNLSELSNKSLRSFLNEAINKKLHQY